MSVREAKPDDLDGVAEIYNYYIANSHATFELDAVDAAEMLRRMERGWQTGYPFLVYESENVLLGYAYAHEYRPRAAYSRTVEVSVYLRPGYGRKSIGANLYKRLIDELEKGDYHAVVAGIALPNDSSVKFHEKFGFTKVAHFREVGRKFDRWIDVGYWELIM